MSSQIEIFIFLHFSTLIFEGLQCHLPVVSLVSYNSHMANGVETHELYLQIVVAVNDS